MSSLDRTESAEPRLLFRHAHRLHGAKEFSAVFAAQMRKHAGPLVVLSRPNGLGYSRLGLSVPRRAGKAHDRVRIKRRLREAFRLFAPQWPAGYDLVVLVRPHRFLQVDEYAQRIGSALHHAHRDWQRREQRRRQAADTAPVDPGTEPRVQENQA